MGHEWRAQFDAEATFHDGGGLQVRRFRLDIPRPEIGDEELAALLVRRLGLSMAAEVRIRNRTVIREAHQGPRGTERETRAEPRRLVELSHVIRHGMTTYPGLPAPEVGDYLSREASRARYARGTEFHIARISMVANTGTYLDSPFHRFARGADLEGLALASVADLEGLVVRVAGGRLRAVDRSLLLPFDVRGRAVLLHTGWDAHWGTPCYAVDSPFLTSEAAAWLAAEGAALVGIDSLNVDDTDDLSRPAHTRLLAAGIPIVEHLCGLDQLPPRGFRFHAAPPLFSGVGTFPVRAYAVIGG